jgi:hypothetical protein
MSGLGPGCSIDFGVGEVFAVFGIIELAYSSIVFLQPILPPEWSSRRRLICDYSRGSRIAIGSGVSILS